MRGKPATKPAKPAKCRICGKALTGGDWMQLSDGTLVHASACEPAKGLPRGKPAKRKPKPAARKQPAKKRKAATKAKGQSKSTTESTEDVVTITDLAKHLHMGPKALRAGIRKKGLIRQYAGRGSRYEWSSMNHPEVRRIIKGME